MLNKTTFLTINLSFKHIKILFKNFDVHINFIGNGLSQCYGFKLFENSTLKLQFIVKQNVSHTNNA